VAVVDLERASEQFFARIHRAALVLTGNPWDADDLAQETFVTLATRQAQFEGRSSLYTWLYGILLNLERQLRRRNGMRRDKLRVLWDNDVGTDRTTPAAETAIEVAEWKKSLWSFVSRLPDAQRQTLVLRFSEHLSYEEIAQALECPLGTVKSRIHHGLATVRELMLAENRADLQIAPQHPGEDVSHAV
jgi:RNA polymerase sigma-70 factor (ECF subfamily)